MAVTIKVRIDRRQQVARQCADVAAHPGLLESEMLCCTTGGRLGHVGDDNPACLRLLREHRASGPGGVFTGHAHAPGAICAAPISFMRPLLRQTCVLSAFPRKRRVRAAARSPMRSSAQGSLCAHIALAYRAAGCRVAFRNGSFEICEGKLQSRPRVGHETNAMKIACQCCLHPQLRVARVPHPRQPQEPAPRPSPQTLWGKPRDPPWSRSLVNERLVVTMAERLSMHLMDRAV